MDSGKSVPFGPAEVCPLFLSASLIHQPDGMRRPRRSTACIRVKPSARPPTMVTTSTLSLWTISHSVAEGFTRSSL